MPTKKTKLPDFNKMSDSEIAKFWDEHDAAEFWPEMKEEQLRRIAEAKGIGYQTLIRMWIKERLKQEAS